MSTKKSTRGQKSGRGKRPKVKSEPFSIKHLQKILAGRIKEARERRK